MMFREHTDSVDSTGNPPSAGPTTTPSKRSHNMPHTDLIDFTFRKPNEELFLKTTLAPVVRAF
jgi:hypothetical protein